jgi:hypothetical protein
MYTKQKTEHKRNRKMERRQQARRKRKNEPSEKEKLRPPKTTENYCQLYCRRQKKVPRPQMHHQTESYIVDE